MKKRMTNVITAVLIGVLVPVLLTAVQGVRYRGTYTGMTINNFKKVVPEEERFDYSSYTFYRNAIGGHIVARHDHEANRIVDIQCVDAWRVNSTDATFAKIKEGMSVEQVVSMVGIPYGSATFGMCTLSYKSQSGATYVVYLDSTVDGQGFSVSSVKKQ